MIVEDFVAPDGSVKLALTECTLSLSVSNVLHDRTTRAKRRMRTRRQNLSHAGLTSEMLGPPVSMSQVATNHKIFYVSSKKVRPKGASTTAA